MTGFDLLEQGDHCVRDGYVAGSERDLWSLGEVLLDAGHLRDVLAMRDECGIASGQLVEVQELIDLEHVPHDDHGQVRERELLAGDEVNICKLLFIKVYSIIRTYILCRKIVKQSTIKSRTPLPTTNFSSVMFSCTYFSNSGSNFFCASM